VELQKKILLILLGLALSLTGLSQSCLPEGIYFSTQAQIDSFQANFPGCTEIEGNLNIFDEYGDNITNLNGLNVLNSVGGALEIQYNFALTNLTGLNNITSIGGDLTITYNPSLTNISALENIDANTINCINIFFNSSLSSCEIQSICDYLLNPNGTINIYNNANGCNKPSEIAGACGIPDFCIPLGNYYFLTQNDIDSFQTDYPNCTELAGNVMINDDIYNLNGLNTVTTIGGDLMIGYMPEWWGTWHLKNLTGLDNLNSIGGNLFICSNYELHDLTGLDNLTSIGGGLTIIENIFLKNLEGLAGLSAIGGEIFIKYNSSLNSLSGLDSIDANSITDLIISNNDSLSSCEVLSICDYLISPNGDIKIHDNNPRCNSQEEVEAACGVGLEDLVSLESLISIYPNPSFSQFTIEAKIPLIQGIIDIFSMNGQELNHYQITEPKMVININYLPAGVYFVRFTIDAEVRMFKIIKY
jgi:hypothetical protein